MGRAQQPAESIEEKRYAPRKMVALTLRAWVDGSEREVKVRDLSHTGFLAESKPALAFNQTIELELPDEERRKARVVWAGDALAGCTFLDPISKASLGISLLKSDFVGPIADRQMQSTTANSFLIEEDAPAVEMIPMWARIGVIGAASIALWAAILGVGAAVI